MSSPTCPVDGIARLHPHQHQARLWYLTVYAEIDTLMSGPLTPEGFDVAKPVSAKRDNCRVTVGFDKDHNHIPRFLV